MLTDVNSSGGGLNLGNLTDVNGNLFFTANDGIDGVQLWEYNAAAGSTVMLSDVNTSGGGFNPGNLTSVNGNLVFTANDGADGVQLWEYSSTAGSTAMLSDVNPTAGGFYNYGNWTNVNGALFFTANDGTHGTELWESDGTSAGTFMVADINPGSGGSYPANLTNLNGTLYFTANDGTHGNELWELQTNPATTATVASSSSTSVSGQVVTFTATVSSVAPGMDTPTGSVSFMDGTTVLGTAPLDSSDTATFSSSTLAVGSHAITAVYDGDSFFTTNSSAVLTQTVNDNTPTNLRDVINDQPPPAQGTSTTITVQPATSDQTNTAVAAVSGLSNPSTPVTVELDLGSQTTMSTTPIDPPSEVQVVLTSSSSSGATVTGATVSGGNVVVQAGVTPSNWTVNGGNVTVQGSATAGDFIVNGGTVTLADGTVITGNSPAIIVNGGTVILQGVTAQTATNSPTIVVNGGSLIVRNSTIQESTGYAQAAILINGGSVDLGTAASPGGNTFNVNGTGTLIQNTSGSAVPAVGDTFENNGTAVASEFRRREPVGSARSNGQPGGSTGLQPGLT